MTRHLPQSSVPRRTALIGGLLAACSKSTPGALVVGAAADLADVFAKLAAPFEQRRGVKVQATFGASKLLARQLREGAPFDVLALADVRIVDGLVKANLVVGETVAVFARGALVVVTADGTPPPAKLEDLANPLFSRIAIANPELAPYGRAAKQALEKANLWGTLEPRIVRGENVQQALAYVTSGNATAALVPRGLALSRPSLPVDPALHDPIRQGAGATATSKQPELAGAFVDHLIRAPARDELVKAGFLAP